MAAPNGQFFVQDKLGSVAPHHESFQQLWETKWKQPVNTTCLLPGVAALMPDKVYHGSVSFHVWLCERLRARG